MKAQLMMSVVAAVAWTACTTTTVADVAVYPAPDVPGWTEQGTLECRGGVWAVVSESEVGPMRGFGGDSKQRPFTERLFFCCPQPGSAPVCRRAGWVDRRTPPKSRQDVSQCDDLCDIYASLVRDEGLPIGERGDVCSERCPSWPQSVRQCGMRASSLAQMQACIEQ